MGFFDDGRNDADGVLVTMAPSRVSAQLMALEQLGASMTLRRDRRPPVTRVRRLMRRVRSRRTPTSEARRTSVMSGTD
jgi:hypothetical protein